MMEHHVQQDTFYNVDKPGILNNPLNFYAMKIIIIINNNC